MNDLEIKNINIPFKADVAPQEREEYLTNIRDLLINKREFIVGLLNNPNLLEKEEFIRIKKDEIIPFIEEELVIRYYYQAAGVQLRLRYDTQLHKAIEL